MIRTSILVTLVSLTLGGIATAQQREWQSYVQANNLAQTAVSVQNNFQSQLGARIAAFNAGMRATSYVARMNAKAAYQRYLKEFRVSCNNVVSTHKTALWRLGKWVEAGGNKALYRIHRNALQGTLNGIYETITYIARLHRESMKRN